VAIGLAGTLGEGFAWRTRGEISLAEQDARISANYGLHQDCEGKFNSSQNCFTSQPPRVLLWGDSFAMHLAQGIVASEEGVALRQHTKSVCAPVIGIAYVGGKYGVDWAEECIAFNRQVIDWLRAQDEIELVVLSSPFSQLLSSSVLLDGGALMEDPDIAYIADAIIRTVDEIRKAGARVVIVSPTPESGWDVGQCLVRSVYFSMDEESCNFSLETSAGPFSLLEAVEDEVAIYWLYEDFCRNAICDVMQDGVFIFRDGRHLSIEGSAFLGVQNGWMKRFRQIAN
jgi:SGNH domain (fused to AT3 domains)